jgi:hypothetical protein
MHNRLTAAMMVAAVVVAAAGSGVAIGASKQPAAKACVSKTSHRLALLENGKCARGYAKTTLGAQGPRGKTGPQGPGATYQQETVSNNDIESTDNVAGFTVATTCGMAAGVTVDLTPASGSGTFEMYGTRSQDASLSVVSLVTATNLSATGNSDVAFDGVTRVGSGSFVDLHISGIWLDNKCTITEVVVPTKAAT